MRPNYNLDRLGWKSFQHLCGTILTTTLGQTYQTFAEGNDGGQDGAFMGEWKATSGTFYKGSFTVQCKHTSKPNGQFSMSTMRAEIENAKRLGAAAKATNYFLLTNYSISAVTASRIEASFKAIPGIEHCLVFDRSWIEAKIHSSKDLRMIVPRLYGLGDLTQILDERAYEQAQAILKHLGNDFACFVPTKSHQDSIGALNSKGFVFLLGEPCCGKSTIALSLALASVDLWGSSLVRVDRPDHFRDHWNPKEPNQFFWVDDAFGTTQYERELALEWNRNFSALQTAIGKGARVVFTSRDYIYRAAIDDLKESSFTLLRDAKVVIRVEQISKSEREQILYNHIKLGAQPPTTKKAMSAFMPEIAEHERFLPETARRLSDPFFTASLTCSRVSLLDFVENMKEFLMENLKTFGDANRSAVALVFMRKGVLSCDLNLNAKEEHAIALMGASIGQVRNALLALSPTLLLNTDVEGRACWKFKHPSIRDAFGTYISEDPSLRALYLENTDVRSLMLEISCGDNKIEGVKLNVPSHLYPQVVERLIELDQQNDADFDALVQFLRNRCDKSFIALFLLRRPRFPSRLRMGHWLRYNNNTRLAAKLHTFGLLHERARKRHVAAMINISVTFADSSCLDVPEIRAMLDDEDERALRRDLKAALMGNLRYSITWTKRYCIKHELNALELYSELRKSVNSFRINFRNTRSFRARLSAAADRIDRVVNSLRQKNKQRQSDMLSEHHEDQVASRSIFDDVFE